MNAFVVLALFLATLGLIASGRVARCVAALAGASLLMGLGFISFETAIGYVDFNTLGLLMGMMIIVGVLSRTGVFQYVAVKTMKLTKGNGVVTLFAIAGVTAVLSAFLDNVTTVLLISPIVVSVADIMDTDPVPLLMAEVLASNIGGTATLIGDPPNIIIGSYAEFSFVDFLVTLAPAATVIRDVVLVFLAYHVRDELEITPDQFARISGIDEKKTIKDSRLLVKAGLAMGAVLAGFTLHHVLHLEAAVIALVGAALLLLVTPGDGDHIIHNDVEWPTLVFFISLFIVVGALKEAGIISIVASGLAAAVEGHPFLALLAVLWFSGLSCAFINNVAFTATFVYVIDEMAQALATPAEPLFWALALGACLGGNGSFLGSAANVVVADIARRGGHFISFGGFMKIGMKTTVISLALSSVYLFLRFGL